MAHGPKRVPIGVFTDHFGRQAPTSAPEPAQFLPGGEDLVETWGRQPAPAAAVVVQVDDRDAVTTAVRTDAEGDVFCSTANMCVTQIMTHVRLLKHVLYHSNYNKWNITTE